MIRQLLSDLSKVHGKKKTTRNNQNWQWHIFQKSRNRTFYGIEDLDLAKIKTYLTNKGVNSKFHPPSSPWMVTSWESIVSIIKQSRKLVLKDRSGHEEPLRTFLVSLEFIVNSL